MCTENPETNENSKKSSENFPKTWYTEKILTRVFDHNQHNTSRPNINNSLIHSAAPPTTGLENIENIIPRASAIKNRSSFRQ
jgi:hypothetical protein